MHSLIIVSKDLQKRQRYLEKLCRENNIDHFDISLLESEKAIGIESVRNFQEKIFLKPLKSKIKAVILKIDQGITLEAQNALLKILEEPPEDTTIVLSIANEDLLLPTILSRCKTISLDEKQIELSKEEITQYLNILVSLLSSGAGERLKFAQDYGRTKEEALFFLEKMIMAIRKKMIEDQVGKKSDLITQYPNLLISFQPAHKTISTTNVNPRYVLENLFLNL